MPRHLPLGNRYCRHIGSRDINNTVNMSSVEADAKIQDSRSPDEMVLYAVNIESVI